MAWRLFQGAQKLDQCLDFRLRQSHIQHLGALFDRGGICQPLGQVFRCIVQHPGDFGTAAETRQIGADLADCRRNARNDVASGATLEDVAASVNSHTGETGVEASVEDGRVVLRSESFGSDTFVSVEIVDDGGVTGTTTGVYTFVEGDAAQIDLA
ncbi:MAG: hypothetical protein IIC13_14705, partial [SAR324 cluster bacterium]|nr:hypothetical protein [SAR324 cluster bacterium]